jgi:hypothetical protein
MLDGSGTKKKDKSKDLLNYQETVRKCKHTYKSSRKKLSDIAKENKLQIKLDAFIDKVKVQINNLKEKRGK